MSPRLLKFLPDADGRLDAKEYEDWRFGTIMGDPKGEVDREITMIMRGLVSHTHDEQEETADPHHIRVSLDDAKHNAVFLVNIAERHPIPGGVHSS